MWHGQRWLSGVRGFHRSWCSDGTGYKCGSNEHMYEKRDDWGGNGFISFGLWINEDVIDEQGAVLLGWMKNCY